MDFIYWKAKTQKENFALILARKLCEGTPRDRQTNRLTDWQTTSALDL